MRLQRLQLTLRCYSDCFGQATLWASDLLNLLSITSNIVCRVYRLRLGLGAREANGLFLYN